MTFHNSALGRLVPDGNYRADDLARVEAALSDHQTLTFLGTHGIRRYLGDSYWAPDYEARLSEMDRDPRLR